MIHFISMLLALLLLASCNGRSDSPGYAARQLDLDLPAYQSFSVADSHGGFHGDGLLHMELVFSPEDGATVAESVSSHPSGRWNPFPMDEEMEEFLWGGGAGMAGWPVPEEGWWYLMDRQTDGEGSMFGRYSQNYTFACYDSQTNTLRYLELDT